MVEQAHPGKRHHHAIFIARLNHIVITDRAAGLRNIGNAAAMRTFNIIAKREERIAAKRHA